MLYRHALFGKWHLNHATRDDRSGAPVGADVVRVQGYGHFEGIIHNIVGTDTYFNWPKVSNGESSQCTEYATSSTVNDFLRWRASGSEPYFAVISFNAPHTPLHAPPRELHDTLLEPTWGPREKPRRHYKAMVEAMDAELGRLLSTLGSSLANTNVIFMGDNGTPPQILEADPYRSLETDHGKGSAYEGGVNVPFFVSGPAVLAGGTESTAFVHAVDIFATVAEFAGVDLTNSKVYPEDRVLDSISIVPYLEKPSLSSRRPLNFTEKFFANTKEGAQVDESQLKSPPFCQKELEFTGSKDGPKLSICGGALVERSENAVTVRLTGAPPNARAFLLAGGNKPAETARFGGEVTLSPNPLSQISTLEGKLSLEEPFRTNDRGVLKIPGVVHQQNNLTDYFIQVAVQDPASLKWSISNAVRINQTINVKAVVDTSGYKLIAYISGGHSELYHLPSDPRELVDLLANGVEALTEAESDAHQRLSEVVRAKLASE